MINSGSWVKNLSISWKFLAYKSPYFNCLEERITLHYVQSWEFCPLFLNVSLLFRVHLFVLTTHKMEFADLDPRANLTTRWELWVTVPPRLPWLICRLLPILWDPQMQLWLHHPRHQIWGPSFFPRSAKNPSHRKCLLLKVQVLQSVLCTRKVGKFPKQLLSNLHRGLPLQVAAVA